jgi:hypothetical protein
MNYETALETCSEEVRAAIKWLEGQVRFDKNKWENRLEKVNGWEKDQIRRRLTAKYLCRDAIEFYVLSKVKSPLLKEFLDASKNKEFWLEEGGFKGFNDKLYVEPYLLWYLSKMGLKSNKYFEEALDEFIKKPQTREGNIPINPSADPSHSLALRVLASVEPDSEATDLAVRYFLDNLDEFKSFAKNFGLGELSIGMLALGELDYLKYKGTIEDLCNFFKSEQNEKGYWDKYCRIMETSRMVEALSRVFGQKDECVIKAVNWIKSNTKEEESRGSVRDTAYACLALMSVGEGPKASLEEIEWNETLTRQKVELTKPKFVQTSPNLGVTEIKEKIHEMLNNANERIWICSRFITEFWADIIKLKHEKPNLDVKIITLPKDEAYNKYKGEGRKFVHPAFDTLQRLLRKDFKPEPLLHARLYIVDNEVLVSSADITSEQLEKEFNAGIWTRDKETVEDAIKFFENIWTESEGKTQLTEEKGS